MICKKCGVEGDFDLFYKSCLTRCKTCYKERQKASQAEWQKNNYPRVRANASKSAALARGAVLCTCCTVEDFIPLFEKAIDETILTGVKHEVDHIVPCRKGGLHCAKNSQVITKYENIIKG